MARAEEILDLTPLPGADVDVGNDALVIADASAGVQKKIIVAELPGGGASDAASITYDNAESGRTAEDVQAALDEPLPLPAGFAVDPEDETYLQSELGNIRLGLTINPPFTDIRDGSVTIQGDDGLNVYDVLNDGTFQFTADSSGVTVVMAETFRLNINATGIGFYGATPVAQPAAVADATDNPSAITQFNDLLAKLRTLGLIDT